MWNRIKNIASIKIHKSMCVLVLLLSLSFLSNRSFSQKALEIGGNLALSYYMGDVNLGKHFYSPHLGFGGFMKLHFDSRSVLKAGILFTDLSGNDQDFNNEFQRLRNHSFKTSLFEISALYEVHFLPYSVSDIKKLSFTPYLNLGLAVYWAKNAEDKFNFAIPMGFGFKKNIIPRMVVAVEWSFHKTFSDLLDSLSGEDLDAYRTDGGTVITSGNKIKQSGFNYNKDWYSVVYITFSYTFRVGGLKCNAYF